MTGAYQFFKKNGVALGFGIGAILSVLMYVVIFVGLPSDGSSLHESSAFDFGLYTTYTLCIIACIVASIFPIVYVAQNIKESMKGLIAFAILAVLFLVTSAMGDGILTLDMIKTDESLIPVGEEFVSGVTTSGAVAFSDGLIKFAYIMLFLSVASMFAAAGRDFFKQQ